MRTSDRVGSLAALLSLLLPLAAAAQPHPKPSASKPAAEKSSGLTPESESDEKGAGGPAERSTLGEASIFTGLMDPFDYDPRGRRDPFAQPIADKPVSQGSMHGPLLPLQKFDVTQLRLIGIIWDVRRPKAMIRDPEGKTHIVGPNTKIGQRNGYIAVIREGEMVVVETIEQDGKLNSTAQVVKIAR